MSELPNHDRADDDQPIPEFLDAWAAGEATLEPDVIRRLRGQVVRDALDVPFQVPAPPEISGFPYGRRPIRSGDPIDVRLAKYIQHALREEHWPPGTTFEEFLASLVETVRNEQGGIYADRREDNWRLTFVSWSRQWEGLDGGPVIIVMYHCDERRLVTAFQPMRGLRYVDDNEQVGEGAWLRRLR